MSNKTLVLYVFHEYNERVKYFINNAIFKDADTDFMIICNNKKIEYDCPNYVYKVFRNNDGYDFGGWSEGLMKDDFYKNYEKFIFVNSTVLGPFLPNYYNGKWTDIYTSNLKDNIKLFGSTINSCINNKNFLVNNKLLFHVQSYIFAMNKETVEFLIEKGIFSINIHINEYMSVIRNKEIEMCQLILNNNWNIGSLLPYYKNIDFRFPIMNKEVLDDLTFQPYYNVFWNEYDVVFIKGNRINIQNYFKFKV
jgi:hypothetical protein